VNAPEKNVAASDTRLCLDRLRAFRRDQHCQYRGGGANVSCNSDECVRQPGVLLRQPLKTSADGLELVNFAQDRFKRHGRRFRWQWFLVQASVTIPDRNREV
jgi:hypothetical protein